MNTKEFTVTSNCADGTILKGKFVAKMRLSHRDNLKMDGFRRQLLGDKPEAAGDEAQGTATVFAKLWTHITDAPSWWKDSGNGLDLEDGAPVMDVFNALVALEKETLEDLKKKAEEARADLKTDK